jgi:PTS system nitrogen regulatory IIA component
MMISDILSPAAVYPLVRAGSKKQLLQLLAKNAAQRSGLAADEIYAAISAREKEGSTGLGGGFAIPHGRLATLGRPFAVMAHLETPLDFDALDKGRVDLVAVLLSPEQAGADHLKALAALSRLFRDRKLCEKLRGCRDADAMYVLMTSGDRKQAA